MPVILQLIAVSLAVLTFAVPVHAQADCTKWNTHQFFDEATVAEVRRCLEGGADPDVRTAVGWTPLHFAARHGTAEIVFAAYHGTAETVTVLLEADADPDARGEMWTTPLHVAALHGTAGTVVVLLDAGADASARTIDGETPFELASRNGKLKGTDAYWRLNDELFK